MEKEKKEAPQHALSFHVFETYEDYKRVQDSLKKMTFGGGNIGG